MHLALASVGRNYADLEVACQAISVSREPRVFLCSHCKVGEVIGVVSGVRRRSGVGEQGSVDRRRIPDTTPMTSRALGYSHSREAYTYEEPVRSDDSESGKGPAWKTAAAK